MPSPMLHNPTFNKTNANGIIVGYHSRTVFSYATDVPVNLYDTNVVNESTTDGIQYLIDNSGTNDYHGTHIIPAYYWRPGKTFRISGTIIADSQNNGGSLNMRFGLVPGDMGFEQWLAIQNNNNNHTFANTNNVGPLPVYFSCDIYCSEILDNSSNAIFGASGYYHYNRDNYDSAGNDGESPYVPVYSSDLLYTNMEETYINQSTIMFNLFGTNIDNGTKITQLLIEELA